MQIKNSCALVLGGHVNGYSIIKELHEQGITEIALFDRGRSLARYSNKVKYRAVIDKNSETLLNELNKLRQHYDFIVPFPTDDLQLDHLHVIYDEVLDFCYMPFNRDTLFDASDKFYQYQTCEKIGVPYPKSINVKSVSDLDSIDNLIFPLLLKPSTRKDLTIDVFRNLYFENRADYLNKKSKVAEKIKNGVEFVISEYIPGDDTNIYAYTCFRSQEGEILNEWIGKKLTQYPDNYGVVCSSSNESPEVVLTQGRALVKALNVFGIIEPEFKYDCRDGMYKLMEINLRSMMWHRTGNICGVKLQETQYKYAIQQDVTNYSQVMDRRIHFILMLHEIPNLIARKGYWKYFKHNVFGADIRVWAIFEIRDIKPFIYSLFLLSKMGVTAWLRRFGLR